ncbi:MAG: hypothetical protein QOD51_535 [Candidatus Eremiobacteraeota bacterium]|jgi:hypothetical protein|nr:hypothetical protein [Candidatus Eremiobacteraeota bacterium]
MTFAFLARAVAAVMAALMPVAALAADSTAVVTPFRSMTFEVDFSSRVQERIQISGLPMVNQRYNKVQGAVGGSSWRNLVANGATGKSTIGVDVIAVTGDGLVVDITETGLQRSVPKTRIGITTRGELVYDPNKVLLNEEELLLLQLLNRALVDGHDGDGASWSDDLSAHGFKDVTTYRIVSSTAAQPGPVLHMELERNVSSGAGQPFELTASGSLDYDEHRATPLVVTLRERRKSASATGKEQQVDVLFTYKLVTDTAEKA